jgi:16S rRNA (cytosine1402-N4)-methyltransferase
VCSAQIDTPERGFSFNHPGPLDMRMDKTQDRTLASLLSSTKESDLANIIYQYGQERYSRRVAPVILEAFHAGKIQTTADLAHYVSKVVKQSPLEKKHPATRTFQALRIAVNNELEHLSLFLKAAPTVLKNGGRLALITFHSLEYQIVKEHFMDKLTVMSYEAQHFKMVKIAHPLFPSALEQSSNPRSRSARLHIYEKRVI